MLIYEKDNKLNIKFDLQNGDGNELEEPDFSIYKDEKDGVVINSNGETSQVGGSNLPETGVEDSGKYVVVGDTGEYVLGKKDIYLDSSIYVSSDSLDLQNARNIFIDGNIVTHYERRFANHVLIGINFYCISSSSSNIALMTYTIDDVHQTFTLNSTEVISSTLSDLIVTFDGDSDKNNATCDKTWTEIVTSFPNVQFFYGTSTIYSLTSFFKTSTYIEACYYDYNPKGGYTKITCTINNNNDVGVSIDNS